MSIGLPTPYDTLNDLAPITLVATTSLMITVPAALPVKSLKELVALAKRRPSGQACRRMNGIKE